MSAIACEIIGTGDGKIKNVTKNEGTASKTIAKDIVLEIIDNALDIVDDTSDATSENIMDQIPVKDFKDNVAIKKKSGTLLVGTGDHNSNECLDTEEPIVCHPPVEKKNRLTDLVKNSKQILARIIMSDSRIVLQEEKKQEEKLVEVIELDCIQISDLPFKSSSKILPEEVPLPTNDSQDILTPPSSEELMDEIGLSPTTEESKEPTEKKRMTFPRASASRTKAAFAAKCKTWKREATNLKQKKWNVSGKIVNFFRKKREGSTKLNTTQGEKELENVTEYDKE